MGANEPGYSSTFRDCLIWRSSGALLSTEVIETAYIFARPRAEATPPNETVPERRTISRFVITNLDIVRRSGTVSFGGVASARGLAKMYAVSITSVDNKAPLLLQMRQSRNVELYPGSLAPIQQGSVDDAC